MTKAARDITQNVFNVRIYDNAGYDVGINQADATKLGSEMAG